MLAAVFTHLKRTATITSINLRGEVSPIKASLIISWRELRLGVGGRRVAVKFHALKLQKWSSTLVGRTGTVTCTKYTIEIYVCLNSLFYTLYVLSIVHNLTY